MISLTKSNTDLQETTVKKTLMEARDIINSFNNIDDNSVASALSALDRALKLYGNNLPHDTPERIKILDHKGTIIHTIRVNGGFPDTVYMRPKNAYNKWLISLPLLSLVAIGCYLYMSR